MTPEDWKLLDRSYTVAKRRNGSTYQRDIFSSLEACFIYLANLLKHDQRCEEVRVYGKELFITLIKVGSHTSPTGHMWMEKVARDNSYETTEDQGKVIASFQEGTVLAVQGQDTRDLR